MALDPRIILSIPAAMDQNRARNIQQQQADTNSIEAQLRAAELQQRMQELRDAAMRKNAPAAYDPKKADEELTYQMHLGDTVHGQLVAAQKNPAVWSVARQNIARLAGPQAIQDLPEDWESAAPIVDQHVKSWAGQKAELTQKTREIRVRQPDGSEKIMVVEDKPGQEYTSAPPVAAPGSVKTREIETIENGKRVRKIVVDEPGQTFPVPPPAAGAGPVDPLVDVVDPSTGKRVLMRRSKAEGLTPGAAATATTKPATGVQTKTLGYFNRAKQADEDLQAIEPKIAQMGYLDQERMKRAPNLFQTQTGQSYNQAQRAFTEARLRKDSGAAIPESEFANDRVTYFAQPGDTPKTLADKARARAAVLASLAYEAGSALDGFYGDDAPGMIQGYKDRAKSASGPMQRAIPSIPGGIAESTDGGKTWKRVK